MNPNPQRLAPQTRGEIYAASVESVREELLKALWECLVVNEDPDGVFESVERRTNTVRIEHELGTALLSEYRIVMRKRDHDCVCVCRLVSVGDGWAEFQAGW